MELERYLASLRRMFIVRIMEMKSIVEMTSTEDDSTPDNITKLLKEPLYTLVEDENGYLVVVDMPAADNRGLSINGVNNTIHVKCRLDPQVAKGLTAVGGYHYEKTIVLPEDADVSRLTYWFEKGRLYIKVPRRLWEF